MIRATLDTNVLASGFANAQGVPSQILQAWRAGRFHLVASDYILWELPRIFARAYFLQRLTPKQIEGVIALLRSEATIAPIITPVRGVASDPADDLIVAAALSGRADYLVTGDKKLEELGSYQTVKLISPRAFLDMLADLNN